MGPVFVVGDCEEDAAFAVRLLRQAGVTHEIRVASDGGTALDWLASHEPALVLLDLRLPDIDGLDILSRMKDDPRLQLTPVVVVAGMPTDDDVSRCMRAGAEAVLRKDGGFAEQLIRTVVPFLRRPPSCH